MPRHCFVPGCKSRYDKSWRKNKSAGIKNPSMFKAPKDEEALQKWRNAVPRKDRDLTAYDKICELHFTEDCIDRVYRTILYDGTIHDIDREKPVLKRGSIPTLFLNVPKYISVQTKKKKVAQIKKKKAAQTKKKNAAITHTAVAKKIKPNIRNASTETTNCSVRDQDIYKKLLMQLTDIIKPNSWWTVSSTDEYVVCAKWNDNYFCERFIIVCKDLSMKVFLKNKEIQLDDGGSLPLLLSVESLSLLLERVDSLTICNGLDSKGSTDCLGYLTDNNKQLKICSMCDKLRKKNNLKKKTTVQHLGRKLTIAVRLKNVPKENTHLQLKVHKKS